MLLILERKEVRERKTKIDCRPHVPYWRSRPQADMCPDWKSNQRPLSAWGDTEPTEPHRLGLSFSFFFLGLMGKCV